MRFGLGRAAMPSELRAALEPGERILAWVHTGHDAVLAASRLGLWTVTDDAAARTAWHHISKARLLDTVLYLTVADEVATWPDGTVMVRDRAETAHRPERATSLTDSIHQRVRASVVASRYLPWPGAGGWVVLRRIAGADGLVAQVRLDPGADQAADGFGAAVGAVLDDLWPAEVQRPYRPAVPND